MTLRRSKLSRSRAGRKAWDTRLKYAAAMTSACGQIGQNVRNEIAFHGGLVTRTILRTPYASFLHRLENESEKKPQEITSSQAVMEIDRSFSPLGDFGFSAALGLIFDSGATVYTKKASYKLATRTVKPVPDSNI